ncbi:hypothetical protein WOB72_22610 [Vibrio parahaemolyticus]
MEQELFNKYFLDTNKWVKKAREHMISAHYLVHIHSELFGKGNEPIQGYQPELIRHPFEAYKSVGDSSSLLIGFALENALKAHLIEKGAIFIDENGKVKGLNGSHDLVSMLEKSSFEPDEKESEIIRLLTFQLQSLSRYHLARNRKKQAEFSGRVDNPLTYYNLVSKIIINILSEKLKNVYLEPGEDYSHIPQTPNFR